KVVQQTTQPTRGDDVGQCIGHVVDLNNRGVDHVAGGAVTQEAVQHRCQQVGNVIRHIGYHFVGGIERVGIVGIELPARQRCQGIIDLSQQSVLQLHDGTK